MNMPIVEIYYPVPEVTIDGCNEFNGIETIDQNITYAKFFEKFMLRNLPCVIKNVAATWPCTRNWIEDKNKINYKYFIEKYGDVEAPVADCNKLNFNAHCKSTMKVKDYMNYLKMTEKQKLLYLKDWHLQKQCPDEKFYEVPIFFSSDWLNEFATDLKEDDFRFVYIGPKSSWTPLHADVYNSFSWSVNVIGKKKWLFFPPGEEHKLKDSLGNLPLLFTNDKFPGVKYFEIVQEKGDALFVPSGWHHQVENILETISINHNWVNACNLEIVWTSLQNCLMSVENEISDLRDTPEFIDQCQLILKSLFGMNFFDFVVFVLHIGKKRVTQISDANEDTYHVFELGKNHMLFDLKVLFKVMNLIHSYPLFAKNILPPDVTHSFVSIMDKIFNLL